MIECPSLLLGQPTAYARTLLSSKAQSQWAANKHIRSSACAMVPILDGAVLRLRNAAVSSTSLLLVIFWWDVC